MDKICPICNGLQVPHLKCRFCGQILTDGGAIENYFGPYSPYMDTDSVQNYLPDTQCVHLLYCPHCHVDIRAAWELVEI